MNILNGALTGNLRTQWLDLSAGVRKMEMNGCAACGRAASPARQACVGAVMEHTLESRPRARDSMSVWSHWSRVALKLQSAHSHTWIQTKT